jgi:hypothetical protein
MSLLKAFDKLKTDNDGKYISTDIQELEKLEA